MFKTSVRSFPGMVLIYDIIGFTRFYNQPDVFNYAAPYLNIVKKYVDGILAYERLPWADDDPDRQGPRTPVHRKFMGDGELMVFACSPDDGTGGGSHIKSLINDLWTLMTHADELNAKARNTVPVAELPPGIRFSLTRGTILELTPEDENAAKEYVGVPLNLAARLQSHCRSIRFIASAKIGPSKIRPDDADYKRLIIKDLKGFPPELVYVDAASYDALSEQDREELFDDV